MAQFQRMVRKPTRPIEVWKHEDVGTMLINRPTFVIVDDADDQVLTHELVCQLPNLKLKDGCSISVQASALHTCSPKNNEGPYDTVECGRISDPPDSWEGFADNWDLKTITIYRDIPLAYVLMYIAAHGGVDVEATFKKYNEYKLL